MTLGIRLWNVTGDQHIVLLNFLPGIDCIFSEYTALLLMLKSQMVVCYLT